MKVVDVFGDLPKLETERLYLRKVHMDDAPSIFNYGTNEQVTKYVSWDTYSSMEDAIDFIQFAQNRYKKKQIGPGGIVFRKDSRLIGSGDCVSWQPEYRAVEIGC